ncbi:MAG TPA: PDZ domain-containing protein [Gemmatimonadota bacterium]|nr:PDZ domain-containing protein [Gemmatimonadota bacterium]
MRVLESIVLAVVALGLAAPAAAQPGAMVPELHLRDSAEELLEVAYPERYQRDPGALEDDVDWVRDQDDELQEWWARQGPLYLVRASDVAGLPWPYRSIEVYLVRYWPLVSIEYPLVLALDQIQGASGSAQVPQDEDIRILLLAHQLVHYLLDDPPLAVGSRHDPAYDHPFMTAGTFEVESLVNWVTYTVLEELWGPERLDRATADELWRAYNPNHDFVVDELMRRRLSRTYPLTRWLRDNPRGSEIFATLEDYEERSGATDEPAAGGVPGLSGTEYGIDLGASYDGRIFVAYVDEGSPASRAGLVRGDVVRTIEGRDAGTDINDAQRRLRESWEDDREINLSVLREGREVFVTVERR